MNKSGIKINYCIIKDESFQLLFFTICIEKSGLVPYDENASKLQTVLPNE